MRKVFFAIGIFFFTGIVLLFSTEMLYRLVSGTTPHLSGPVLEINDAGHFPRPYVMAVSRPNPKDSINTLGYKGELPPLPKPQDEIRVVMLGGSTVFGNYHFQEKKLGKSLPWHLEQTLKKETPRNVRVYNFGNISSVAIQDLVRLYQDVIHFDPDLVIHYGAGNDYANPDKRAGYPHRFLFYLANPLWISDVREYPLGHLILFGSLFVRHQMRGYFEKFFMNLAGDEHFFHPNLEFTLNNIHSYTHSITAMNKISSAYGSHFVSFAQPLKPMYHGPENAMKADLLRWYKSAEEILKTTDPGLKFVNLMPEFDQRPIDYWRDYIHLSNEGNIDMATVLTRHLKTKFPQLFQGGKH